ncbi:unnamed protein product, partial [Mesorhabditis belari]|uniref:Protein kinase domain-containing protein n=1 Tax=Mesorhabditis belari TaxID=2138241 RepID=A0AAF3EC32_9BILA
MEDNEGPGKYSFVVKGNVITRDIRMPPEYSPQENDQGYRSARIASGVFHSIGRGAQAIVLAATYTKDGVTKNVAVKRYDIQNLRQRSIPNTFTQLLREVHNTRFLVHPNIVKVFDVCYQEGPNGSLHYVLITTERMNHTLDNFFASLEGQRKHRRVVALLVQLFRALEFLHQRGIMHRDISPKNIGMNNTGFEIKLLDFGSCGQTNPFGDHTKQVMTPPIYQPLEVILQKPYNSGVDVWAAGLVALAMLGCKLMFPTDDDMKKNPLNCVKERILNVLGVPSTKYCEIFGPILISEGTREAILEKKLDEAMEDRLDEDQGDLTKGELKKLLIRILDVNPLTRPRAFECLEMKYLQNTHRHLKPTPLAADAIVEKNEKEL